MCGITCILSLASAQQHGAAQQPINGERKGIAERGRLDKELDASFEQIKHRGPDSSGKWISDDGRVGTLAGLRSPLLFTFRTMGKANNCRLSSSWPRPTEHQ
jgi:asparagine synthetase B (glutamine-hydrolysing)